MSKTLGQAHDARVCNALLNNSLKLLEERYRRVKLVLMYMYIIKKHPP